MLANVGIKIYMLLKLLRNTKVKTYIEMLLKTLENLI